MEIQPQKRKFTNETSFNYTNDVVTSGFMKAINNNWAFMVVNMRGRIKIDSIVPNKGTIIKEYKYQGQCKF